MHKIIGLVSIISNISFFIDEMLLFGHLGAVKKPLPAIISMHIRCQLRSLFSAFCVAMNRDAGYDMRCAAMTLIAI